MVIRIRLGQTRNVFRPYEILHKEDPCCCFGVVAVGVRRKGTIRQSRRSSSSSTTKKTTTKTPPPTVVGSCLQGRLNFDQRHLWHPYTSLKSNELSSSRVLPISHAKGCTLYIEGGDHASSSSMLDGMSSWWAAVWGYQHPVLDQAITNQLSKMSHVMFGGLTHQPACELGSNLVQIMHQYETVHRISETKQLNKFFYTDSGSVSVEVALKMAIQYWRGRRGKMRSKILSVRGGYHGDTFGAMSVCDPVGGMHSAFSGVLAQQLFAPRPPCDPTTRLSVIPCPPPSTTSRSFRCHTCTCQDDYEKALQESMDALEQVMHDNHESIAALILEPLVQGAGGMRFYDVKYLQRARQICDQYCILLICDEIATGFGRSGGGDYLFASHNANVQPDIMCIGKALTGGYMTMGAVLTNAEVADGVSSSPNKNDPHHSQPSLPLMHGPTFMANPLACSVAVASTNLIMGKTSDSRLTSGWKQNVERIEQQLISGLAPCLELDHGVVADVRVKGAIGVIELQHPIDTAWVTPRCKELGVWLRPFGRLLYTMPPYIMTDEELQTVCRAMLTIAEETRQHHSS